jgi:steroid 5-alpha reductase family enzyme
MIEPIDTWLGILPGAVALVLVWALVWSVPAIALRRNDLADVGWGLTYPYLTLLVGGVVVAPDFDAEPRATIVVVLLTIWALRLAWHIGRRWASHDVEDKRYARMRESWGGGRQPVNSLLRVFVLQAAIALVVAQPVLIAAAVHGSNTTLGLLDVIGVLLVIAGVILEATADRQLRRFLARRSAGTEDRRYLTTGVWAWSRHPNYAGDAITWWGFGVLGVAACLDMDAPWLLIPAILGPLVMTGFLRFGSGVPLSERGRSGHPEWDAYVRRTSVFLPFPPRTEAEADR